MFLHTKNNVNDSTRERKQNGIWLIYRIQPATNHTTISLDVQTPKRLFRYRVDPFTDDPGQDLTLEIKSQGKGWPWNVRSILW